MKLQHLKHRYGGTVLEITHIAHATHGKGRNAQAEWYFIGSVQWDDKSGISKDAEISPAHLCYDVDNPASRAELDTLMQQMNEHLAKHGEWSSKGRMGWTPKMREAQTPVAA